MTEYGDRNRHESGSTSTRPTGAGLKTFWNDQPPLLIDTRVPGKSADVSALLPWIDDAGTPIGPSELAVRGASAGTMSGDAGSKAELRDATSVEESVVATSLRAAQHALDSALLEPSEYRTAVSHASAAFIHLEHAYRTIEGRSQKRGAALIDAANQFSLSLSEFSEHAIGHSLRQVSELAVLNTDLRHQLGLPGQATVETRTSELKHDSEYARNALPNALDLISHHAGATYATLIGMGDRNATATSANDTVGSLIAECVSSILEQIEYATLLVGQLDAATVRTAFNTQANRAAIAIVNVSSWLRSRTGTGPAIKSFTTMIARMDRLLASIGSQRVGSHPEPTHSLAEANEAERENTALTTQQQLVWAAIDDLKDRKLAAIHSFEQLAAMHDDKQPSFAAEIAKALLITTLGNVGGHVIGTFLRRALVHGAADVIAGTANDAMQAVSGKAADGAMEPTSKASALTKSRVFFTEGLTIDAAESSKQFKDALTHAIEAKTIMAKDLFLTERAITQALPPIVATYRQEIMLMWPRYVAQASLGATSANGATVTMMDDYFGEKPSRENDFAGKPDRSGTSGVMSVQITIVDEPFTDVEPSVQQEGWQLNDMNSNIEADVMKLTGGQLDRIRLPKEIFVRLKGGSIGTARLAVDEAGQVRDSAGWSHLIVEGGKRKFYSDPQSLWEHLRSRKLAP